MSDEQNAGARSRRGGAEPLARGATIGRYVVVGIVGRGGMGEVYAAYDPELNRRVAVKLVRANSDNGLGAQERRARLLREAQAIAKLSHPNVVVVFDVGTFAGDVFLAMEFVEGQTIGGWLHAQPRSWREVLAVYREAGRGLAAAHGAGLVHRDFKPENIMVARDGGVRVMDFGLATASGSGPWKGPVAPDAISADPDTTVELGPARASTPTVLDSKLTQTGAMLGTPAYMAPEQFAGHVADPRTDQFSFCVALYEGLYDERPFEGTTTVALMTSVAAGRVSDPPPDANVPGWVRRILLRGLNADPAQRFPSMEALLAALAHDPRRQRWRRIAAVVSAAAVLGLGAAHARWRGSPASSGKMCGSGNEKLAGVWEVDGPASARRQAIRRAFLATGKRYAGSAYGGVTQILDRYLTSWSAMYADACRATNVRGEQSAEVLDLRMSCLSERLDRVRALSDVFARANATVVENALAAASALPSLDRCVDVPLLRAVIPPPEDAAAHAQVEALRRELARVKVLGDSGQCAAGAAAASRLVDDAFMLGYLPLQAEALNALGLFGNECTDPGRAIRQLKEAHWAAAASRHDEAATEALIAMSHLGADRLHEIGAARDAVQLAGAILRRMGSGHPSLEASQLAALGVVVSKEGQTEAGLAYLHQALALKEKTLGVEHVDIVRTLDDIGMVLDDSGRFAESITYYERARVMAIRLVGPDHPLMALSVANEGAALNALRRYAEARPHLEHAIAIWNSAGSGPFYLGYAHASLGECLLGLGLTAEAEASLEAALGFYASSPAAFFPAARFALARTLWSRPSARPRALELARQAKTEYEQGGGGSTWRLADVESWLRQHAGS